MHTLRQQRGSAVSRLPGTLLEGFTPTEVWRNSRRVLTSRRLTEERRDGTLLTELAEEEESRPGATQHRRCVRRQDARIPLRLPAGYYPSNLDAGLAVRHFAPTNTH